MICTITSLLSLTILLPFSTGSPSPQFYPLFHNPPPLPHPHQFHAQRRDSLANGNQPSPQVHQNNFSIPASHLDPLSGPAAAEAFKNNAPRQVFGAPSPVYPQSAGYPQGTGFPQGAEFPQGSGYPRGGSGYPQGGAGIPQGYGLPQIYRIDNLIIIANPPQAQPCIPQSFTPSKSDLSNRIPDDDEPSKCTWAVVACCSPGNDNVRYNCFELLGCVGFFFDNSACNPRTVMAAAKAALDFYRRSNNGTSSNANGGTSGGTITNSIQ